MGSIDGHTGFIEHEPAGIDQNDPASGRVEMKDQTYDGRTDVLPILKPISNSTITVQASRPLSVSLFAGLVTVSLSLRLTMILSRSPFWSKNNRSVPCPRT